MFTDMVGYSALSEKNEAQALQLLEEHRRLIRPFFPRHNGREIKTLGDSFLVEFASALEAVRCAFDIQQSLYELNFGRPAESKVLLRIGVHLGDVIHRENDVYGDAVNVASRIEPLAMTGGVCVTVQVYDQIKNKFEFPLLSLGRKDLKNLAEKVEIYQLVLPWQSDTKGERKMDSQRIAVMPLLNISPEPNDEYFADGLTEELIMKLSRLPGLKVIARTSIMNYKHQQKRIRDIANELEVSSIIEGSVRKAGDRMRVTLQLIDPATEEHLWSSNYDRDLGDVFAIQTEIADKVAEALALREFTRRTQEHTPDVLAYTMFLRANHLLHEPWSMPNFKEALALFSQAIERDTRFARAYAGIARAWFFLGTSGYENFSMINEKGKPAAEKAIELAPYEAEAHIAMSMIYLAQDKFELVISEAKKALQFNPNLAEAYQTLGIAQESLEGPAAAIKSFETSLELDPFSLGTIADLVVAYQALGRTAHALELLQKTARVHPTSPEPQLGLARYYMWNQDYLKAQEHLDRYMELGDNRPEIKMSGASLQGTLYAFRGKRREAEELVDYLSGLDKESAGLQGMLPILAVLGKFDEAFECLMRLADIGAWWIGIKYLPHYAPLREDPRFKEFCKKVGIPPS